jgi:hypothetical protein
MNMVFMRGDVAFLIFVINGEVHNLVTWATIGLSLSLLKSRGLREGHAITTRNFGNVRICLKAEKSRETLCRDGLSQSLLGILTCSPAV